MRIQILTKSNGYGLSKDIVVLQEALAGHEITVTPYDKPLRNLKERFHVNLHLELLNPLQFATARVNIAVPNPEWFMPAWIPSLKAVDMVLGKTRDCERIFKAVHQRVEYCGWTTPDTSDRVDYDSPFAIHVAGESFTKGTDQVIEAAREVPELMVHVVVRKKVMGYPSNVGLWQERLTDERLAELRKAPIHIQPSTYEGFGHVINEARSMGAVIITTAASPMDELVDASHALSAPSCLSKPMRLATEQIPCVDSLAECMRIAAKSVQKYGPLWGHRARAAYEQGRENFTTRINELIQ